MVNLNGNLLENQKAKIPYDNRGLNYGDAVFETLRFSGGKIFFWELCGPKARKEPNC